MRLQLSIHLIISILLAAVFGATSLAAQSAIQIDPIVDKGDARILPIRVEATDSGVRALVTTAFRLHGAYQIVSAEAPAKYVFSFALLDPQTASLVIKDARNGAALVDGSYRGATPNEALLKACDGAVEKTLTQPGFFSGKLAFIAEYGGSTEVFVGDLLFSKYTKLTSDGSHSMHPRWSPDGNKIVYTGYYRTGFPDIFLLDLKQNKRHVFASFKGTNTGAEFSPDGSRVAAILSSTGNPELYVGSSTGSNFRRLTQTKSVESDPTWSPDGRSVLVVSDRMGGPQIFRMSASGGAMSRLPTNISGYVTEPDWNPRTNDLVIFTFATGGTFQLGLYDFSANSTTVLTTGPGDSVEARWLNDGRHIVFTRKQGRERSLWLLDTETKRSARISPQNVREPRHPDFVYPSR